MQGNQEYGYRKSIDLDFHEALEKVKSALKEEGFGVLTEIDVDETLRKKLGVDFGKHYEILGACNPKLAYKALQTEMELGLLLPCNVIVYEDQDMTTVSAINPEIAMSGIDNEALAEIAKEAGTRLKSMVDSL